MFASFDRLLWKGKPLNDYSYYVMGQICVAKKYRGRGVFDMLYNKHRDIYQSQYDLIITEVAIRNARSLRAHERAGFTTIQTYRDEQIFLPSGTKLQRCGKDCYSGFVRASFCWE